MFTIYPTGVPCQVDNIIFLYYIMREFFTIAIFKIKADIRMNKTTLNSQKEKHSLLSLRRATFVGLAAHRLRNISIHALLAESDTSQPHCAGSFAISIHALLAESDSGSVPRCAWHNLFLSTLSLRRATTGTTSAGKQQSISIHALLAESDRSRPRLLSGCRAFLSTLSLRRATADALVIRRLPVISIHALLAESDPWFC